MQPAAHLVRQHICLKVCSDGGVRSTIESARSLVRIIAAVVPHSRGSGEFSCRRFSGVDAQNAHLLLRITPGVALLVPV